MSDYIIYSICIYTGCPQGEWMTIDRSCRHLCRHESPTTFLSWVAVTNATENLSFQKTLLEWKDVQLYGRSSIYNYHTWYCLVMSYSVTLQLLFLFHLLRTTVNTSIFQPKIHKTLPPASPIIFSHDSGSPVKFTGRVCCVRTRQSWRLEPATFWMGRYTLEN